MEWHRKLQRRKVIGWLGYGAFIGGCVALSVWASLEQIMWRRSIDESLARLATIADRMAVESRPEAR